MKKSKTILKATAVVAAGLVTSPFATNVVKADTVEPTAPQTEETTVATVKEPSLAEVKTQVEAAENQVAETKSAFEALDQQVGQNQTELVDATSAKEKTEQTIEQSSKELEVAQSQLGETENKLAEAQSTYDSEVAKNPELATELENAETELTEAKANQASLESEADTTSKAVEVAEQTLKETQSELDKTNTSIGSLVGEVEQSKQTVATNENELTAAKTELATTEQTVADKTAQLQAAVNSAGQDTVISTRTVEVSKVDGSQQVESTKSSKHEQVIYAGEKAVEIKLNQAQLKEYKEKGYYTYSPDAEAVSQHMVAMLKELRTLNGITLPVPEVSTAAMDYATKRVEEIRASRVLSHNTSLDTSARNGENAGLLKLATTSNSATAILSDEQMAYYLLNLYFADYENLYGGYGHRVALLTASGDGLGNGFAGRYHVMNFMDYSKVTDTVEFSREYWDVLSNITYANDAENTMYYNGKRLTFLPRTTFSYVTKITETLPNTAKAVAEKALSDYKKSSAVLLNEAQNKVTQAEANLAQAKSALSAKENQLQSAKASASQLEKAIVEVQAKVKATKEKDQVAQDNLKAAEEVTASKQAVVNALIAKSSSLISAKANLTKAQERVTSLQAIISNLESSSAQAEKTKIEKAELIQALSAKLAILMPERDAAKQAFDAASTELVELQRLLNHLQAKAILDIKPLTVQSENNGTTKNADHVVSSQVPVNKSVNKPTATTSVARAKTLPNTGDASTPLLAGIGLLIGLAGLAPRRKKH
ncbi:TPA: LPXTG cell wall anchor domain-containing protein [Streptococcus suis]|uniref:LPXTG cell wall anchor domain-containing protein n=1 Tax=Streptococcus suis TaxID=1307 RepID=UPI002A783C10|nr:LPXTG cell wall anchor domain-containing protein [Streptococcus suis]HEM6022156.1 LPXTG cell wall anchor domain-containing protein [Streptococcus suis]HEM6037589.1 LPXTG cell wall anchor domain-containing protein [Streptococcus suis]